MSRDTRILAALAAAAALTICGTTTQFAGATTAASIASKGHATTVQAPAEDEADDTSLSPMQRAMRDLMADTPAGKTTTRAAIATTEAGAITPEEVGAELEANGATDVTITVEDEPDEVIAGQGGGLPTDTFKVHKAWASYFENGKTYIAFYGYWDYKPGVIGSGSPYDAAAMKLTGFPQTCFYNASEGIRTTDSEGHRTTGYTSKYEDGHASTVWNVNDDTSAFTLKTGHGFAWIEMRRDKSGCTGDKQAKFWHEHNQQGNGGWSAGFNLWIFHMDYSGSAGQSLRKTTRLSTYNGQ